MQQVARAAFPNGTLCLHIADVFGPIYTDAQFTDLFPRRRPGACGVSEAAASACHDTMLGAKAPGRLQTTL